MCDKKCVGGTRVAKHRKLGDQPVCSCVEMCDDLMVNFEVVFPISPPLLPICSCKCTGQIVNLEVCNVHILFIVHNKST